MQRARRTRGGRRSAATLVRAGLRRGTVAASPPPGAIEAGRRGSDLPVRAASRAARRDAGRRGGRPSAPSPSTDAAAVPASASEGSTAPFQATTTDRQAAKGTKLSAITPSTGSRLSNSVAPAPTRIGEQHQPDQPGVDHHADALDVEHAAGDQLAGVHAVVEAEAEALQLRVVRHAQVVGDALPDRLALVVVPHREQAAQHAGAEQERGGRPEGGCARQLRHRRPEGLARYRPPARDTAGSGAERARQRSWSPRQSPCRVDSAGPCRGRGAGSRSRRVRRRWRLAASARTEPNWWSSRQTRRLSAIP